MPTNWVNTTLTSLIQKLRALKSKDIIYGYIHVKLKVNLKSMNPIKIYEKGNYLLICITSFAL